MRFKPTFNPRQAQVESLIAFLVGFSFFGPYLLLLQAYPAYSAPVIAAVVVLSALCPISYYYLKRSTYEKTEYVLENGKITYSEGFLNTEKKEVDFARVVEVSLKRNVIQRSFGTGTIVLYTAASNQAAGMSGVRFRDVENPDAMYEQVKKVVKGGAQ
jgi:uncharacterized membrane protein YdbT with pleckstrin-like domain